MIPTTLYLPPLPGGASYTIEDNLSLPDTLAAIQFNAKENAQFFEPPVRVLSLTESWKCWQVTLYADRSVELNFAPPAPTVAQNTAPLVTVLYGPGAAPVTKLSDLTDVQITEPLINQFLKYDGGEWVNGYLPTAVAFGSLTGLPTTLAGYGITDAPTRTQLTNTLANYATLLTLNSYVTSDALTAALAGYVLSSGLSAALASYATNDALNAALSSYVSTDSLTTALADYATTDALTSALAGYAPLAGAAFTGDVAVAGNLTQAGTPVNQIIAPLVLTSDAAYTLPQALNNGTLQYGHASGSIIAPVLAVGTHIRIYNILGPVTLTAGTGTNLNWFSGAGVGGGNRSLASGAVVDLVWAADTSIIISGTGIS